MKDFSACNSISTQPRNLARLLVAAAPSTPVVVSPIASGNLPAPTPSQSQPARKQNTIEHDDSLDRVMETDVRGANLRGADADAHAHGSLSKVERLAGESGASGLGKDGAGSGRAHTPQAASTPQTSTALHRPLGMSGGGGLILPTSAGVSASLASTQREGLKVLGLTMKDFLTDGSLARMCDELSRMSGVPVWMRDKSGQAIVPGEGASPWRLMDEADGAARAHALVNRVAISDSTLFVAPIRTTIGDIGSIVMPADWQGDDPHARRALERAVTILASTGVEQVEGMLMLRERVDALDALFRLSSLLVRAEDPDKLLQSALDLAIDALNVDAGTISVLEDNTGPIPPGVSAILGVAGGSTAAEAPLRHRATRNLSASWLSESAPLSIDGQLRASALKGDVVTVSDLLHDERIADSSRPASEGIVSLVATGLIFGGRASGLIRLYSRSLREFTEGEKHLLRAIADHAAMALAHARLRQLREQDAQMRRQLKLAAEVQQRMLPRKQSGSVRFDIAARYAPSSQLGGDFYDVFTCGNRIALAVGDVVGKGVPAALLMSAARASLRAYAGDRLADQPEARAISEAADSNNLSKELNVVMSMVNKATVRDTLESEFVTLWSGLLDEQSLTLTHCSAGHDPALLFTLSTHDHKTQVVDRELTAGGMALGIDPTQTYSSEVEQLAAGQVLVVHTDGLSDATDFENKRFTRSRIRESVIKLLSSEPSASAARIVDHLMLTVRQFAGVRIANDDITLLVVRVRESDRQSQK